MLYLLSCYCFCSFVAYVTSLCSHWGWFGDDQGPRPTAHGPQPTLIGVHSMVILALWTGESQFLSFGLIFRKIIRCDLHLVAVYCKMHLYKSIVMSKEES